MGLLGSGEGTLGLGGTKWDPRTWSAGGKSLADYGVDMTGSYNFEFDALLHDYVKNFQAGLDQAAATTTANVEGIIEDNNDSLADLESGINTTIADTVELGEAGVENIAIGAGALQQGADLIGYGTSVVLDSTINPNNENSALFNPVNWWQEVEGSGKGGWDFLPFGLMPDEDKHAEATAGVIMSLYGGGGSDSYSGYGGGTGTYDPGGGYGTGLGPGITTDLTGSGRNPFAMSGDQRRLIQEEKKFPQQTGNVAPSLINRNKKLLA